MRADKIAFVLEKLRILMRESYDVFDDQQNGCDLTYSQCHTLLEVGTRGEVSLVDLASSLGLDTSTLSRTIQSLVVLGLVTRTTNEKDRRYIKISLSGEGRKVYEAIGRLYYTFMTRVFAFIPARKQAAVLEDIGLFADAMKRANESRGKGGQ
jgi:DNA-binding MarR family transcriptional regulator